MKWPNHFESGVLIDLETRERLEFQVNPDKVTDSKSVNYATATVPGRNYPVYQWVAGEARRIELKLPLHSSEVKKKADWLQSLVQPAYENLSLKSSPHLVLLIFGELYPGLKCVVRSFKAVYPPLFTSNLSPTLAEIYLVLETPE